MTTADALSELRQLANNADSIEGVEAVEVLRTQLDRAERLRAAVRAYRDAHGKCTTYYGVRGGVVFDEEAVIAEALVEAEVRAREAMFAELER